MLAEKREEVDAAEAVLGGAEAAGAQAAQADAAGYAADWHALRWTGLAALPLTEKALLLVVLVQASARDARDRCGAFGRGLACDATA
eukprot:3605291-Pleurochrysis_carterae.AAC.1